MPRPGSTGPSPELMGSGGVHPAAAVGFDRAAEAYERGRPGYPEEAVRYLIETLHVRPGARVLDLAAGTGKLTRMLAPTGAELVAVEPVEGMRKVFASKVPGVPVLGGRAESIPLEDSSVDAAVVAQAFHWFHGPEALGELHRVLRPRGRLALMWNVRDESEPWVAALTELLEDYRSDTPGLRGQGWREAFRSTELFSALRRRSFRHDQRMTVQEVQDRVASISFVARLPDARRAEVGRRLDALLAAHGETAGREVVVMPYRTELWWCERRDRSSGPRGREGTRP